MARETKQDRIMRAIHDQVAEHLHDLKTLESLPSSKEADVERWCQSFIKACMGYSATNGYSIRAQESKGKMRPDLIVFKGERPVLVIEVKKFGFDLNKSDFRSGKTQLSEYLHTLGNVRWGMLTNGTEWKLFDFGQKDYPGVEIACFDLKFDDTIDLSKKAVEEQCYEIYDFHETSFSSDSWSDLSKEALAFSPESMAKAILSMEVVKTIARSIRGEHDYRANVDVLTDKVYELVVNGLNDAMTGWNETKAEEFHRYIKNQKKAARRVKRSKKDSKEETPSIDKVPEVATDSRNSSDAA